MATEINLTGQIVRISPTHQATATFKSRKFVLRTAENPMYPQDLELQFAQDKCSLLDIYQVGDTVTVGVNLKGRAWEDPKTSETKYFNTIEAWRINKAEGQMQGNISATPLPRPPIMPADTGANDDDLPF